ncbi:1,4-dihydroxy-2-naphthoate polyprenyltransferase [Azospirillum sp. sgz301742]
MTVAFARPSGLSLWLQAVRPRTLTISVVPVVTGLAFAWAESGLFHPMVALATLLGAVLIQAGTNLYNDAADGERGLDKAGRVGPPRITAEGWASAAQVKRGAWACFALAALIGLYLAAVGGWPILLVGVLSILAGWAYTGGPLPIAYTPLGEIFVFLFFGVAAVCGTFCLQAGTVSWAALAAGAAIGLPAAAVLHVNNHRDRESDARAGRRTLAIVAGPEAATAIYAGFLLTPFGLLLPMAVLLPHSAVWLALGALPLVVRAIRGFAAEPPGRGLNRFLAETAKVQAVFGALLSLGALL